jgi:hypothetical protein
VTPALAPGPAFRYLGQVRFGVVAKLSFALALWASQACSGRARTPEEAVARLQSAVAARDVGQLFAALDLETRWSWMSVRRAQRESYDIVLSNFPEGPAREQQLRRFEAGALSESDADLFAHVFPVGRWDDLKRDLAPIGNGSPSVERVNDNEARLPGAAIAGRSATDLKFRRGEDGGWGFAGLAAEAEEEKRRFTADLEQVRTNAADLERAAIRAGR